MQGLISFSVINWAGWCHKLIRSFCKVFFPPPVQQDRLQTANAALFTRSVQSADGHYHMWSETQVISSQKGNLSSLKQSSLKRPLVMADSTDLKIPGCQNKIVSFSFAVLAKSQVHSSNLFGFFFFLRFLWAVINNSCTRVVAMVVWYWCNRASSVSLDMQVHMMCSHPVIWQACR